MNYIEQQTEILEKIAQILHEEGEYDYENVKCEFESFGSGSEETAIVTLFISKNGDTLNMGLSDVNLFTAVDLAVNLRRSMKAHTGGEWSSFILTLDANGQAKSKFHYPEGGGI